MQLNIFREIAETKNVHSMLSGIHFFLLHSNKMNYPDNLI